MRHLLVLAATVLAWSATASAAPNPWPFDFDPSLAEDPQGIVDDLAELEAGLPGLPPEGMVESQLGEVSLYLFADLADALDRARDSGPELAPPTPREPVLCARHAAFEMPRLLIEPASTACEQAEQAIAQSFVDLLTTCMDVEYPETYVFRHPPGQVGTDTVQSFEGLIALAGEALGHLDYPAGLMPNDFMSTARTVIAKLRYPTLKQHIGERLAAYDQALSRLQDSAACFDPEARTLLVDRVEELIVELGALGQQLEDLYAQGLARAELDREAVVQSCRLRNQLPYPSLTDRERELLAFYIGGIYWRMRGAGLIAYPPDPEQGLLRRILYVKYPYQAIADLTGGSGGDGVGDSILFDENWGWDEWWDMGTSPGSADKYSDLVGMTNRGKRGVQTVGPQLADRGYDTRSLVAGGLQMGPCYYYAWEVLSDFRLGESLQDPYMWFIEWPTSVGEFCEGAALGIGLARTLLLGTPNPDPSCVPGCVDRECGDDGFGGSCGSCSGELVCNDSGQCELPGAHDADAGVVPAADAGVAGDPDAGGSSADTPTGGCSAGTAPTGIWLVLFSLLAVLRRRR